MQTKDRTNRNIRLSSTEWEDFKRLLGAAWLRGQIAKAVKREQRKPVTQEQPK